MFGKYLYFSLNENHEIYQQESANVQNIAKILRQQSLQPKI